MDRKTIQQILDERKIVLSALHDQESTDDVAKKLPPVSNIFGAFATPWRDLLARRNIGSSAEQSQTYTASYEKAVAATALAINRARLNVRQTLDTQQGAYFEIAFGATLLIVESDLYLRIIIQSDSEVLIEGKYEMPGQWGGAFGKGKSALQNVFEGVDYYLHLLTS